MDSPLNAKCDFVEELFIGFFRFDPDLPQIFVYLCFELIGGRFLQRVCDGHWPLLELAQFPLAVTQLSKRCPWIHRALWRSGPFRFETTCRGSFNHILGGLIKPCWCVLQHLWSPNAFQVRARTHNLWTPIHRSFGVVRKNRIFEYKISKQSV